VKNITSALFIFIITFSVVFNCTSQTNSNDNSVKFKINAPQNTNPLNSKFKIIDYEFPAKEVSVMSGSNSGLIIDFQKTESDNSTLTLSFQLPSGNVFSVYATDKKYEYKFPDTPCTITNEDFKDIKSLRNKDNVVSYISLVYSIKDAFDQSRDEGINFDIFSIYITKFNFVNDKINFTCTFYGEIREYDKSFYDADYKIFGSFELNEFDVKLVKVEE
jgi:hypothetical protein